MESDELRFKRVGLSSDGAVIFCEMDNGKTYSMPIRSLERAEDWDREAKPLAIRMIHDGFAAAVDFDSGDSIDFPSDFVLHVCEPSYTWYKDKGRSASGVGERIREIRGFRGLTLDALAVKCGIAKPNLSRLENDKVTPKVGTLTAIAAALGTHPVLLVTAEKPEQALIYALHKFDGWRASLRWTRGCPQSVHGVDMVKVFLAQWPECGFARERILETECCSTPHAPEPDTCSLNGDDWAREVIAAKAAQERARRGKRPVSAVQ